MRQAQGLTLIELLIGLSMLAILAALAAPSFSTARLNAQRTRAVNDFWHAIFLARSEAIKRGGAVTLCKSPNGLSCNTGAGDWAEGWIVFHNIDRDEPAQVDPDEPVLMRSQSWPQGHILANRNSFSFRPANQGVVNGTVVFCDQRGSTEARAIIINHTGRPRLSQRDASDRPLSCPN